MNVMREVVTLQKQYQDLVKIKHFTKKAMCDLLVPFRDKYNLSDSQALAIARNEMPLDTMVEVLSMDNMPMKGASNK